MPLIECGPRRWEIPTARPVVALQIVRAETYADYLDLLLDHMGPDEGALLLAALRDGAVPEDAVIVLVEEWLERSTGLPLNAVGALCSVAVREWPSVRGRLIRSGIARPLHDLGTLGALLSAVWDMLQEGAEDEKARDKLRREVFRPRVKRRATATPARTISAADQRAQSAILATMVADED